MNTTQSLREDFPQQAPLHTSQTPLLQLALIELRLLFLSYTVLYL